MKLHEFTRVLGKSTLMNLEAALPKFTYVVHDENGAHEVCDIKKHTEGMSGTIYYYQWYLNGLAANEGFISVDNEGTITEDRCIGIS